MVHGLLQFGLSHRFKVAGLRLNDDTLVDLQLTNLVPQRCKVMPGFVHFSFVASQEPNHVLHGTSMRRGSMTMPPNKRRKHPVMRRFKVRRSSLVVVFSNWMLVGLGGACGAVLRYAVGVNLPSEGFPWATLTVNLVGSLFLGAVTALVAANAMSEQHALLLGVGVLGSFTTLSTFSVETMTFANEGRWSLLVAYAALTGVAGPLLALAGWKGAEAWL